MTSDLQQLVDDFGRRLSRSVAIDDPALRLLVYSAHHAEVDPGRAASILERSAPKAVVDYVYECGARDATGAFTVPAKPELRILTSRVGVPVRHREHLLGFVWLLESEGSVGREDLEALQDCAERAQVILQRESLLTGQAQLRSRELAAELFAKRSGPREKAAGSLVEEGWFESGPALAIVVSLGVAPGERLSEAERLAVTAGLEHARQTSSQRCSLQVERPDHGVVILNRKHETQSRELTALCSGMRERVLAELPSGPAPYCTIGIGARRDELANVFDSYQQAKRAATVCQAVKDLGPVARHADLGIYGVLAQLPPDELRRSIPAGMRALLDNPKPGPNVLFETLARFLDNAGDVKRTAEDLQLHRQSLYYRLQRIEEVSGLDLNDGDTRLSLHVGLRSAKLLGLY